MLKKRGEWRLKLAVTDDLLSGSASKWSKCPIRFVLLALHDEYGSYDTQKLFVSPLAWTIQMLQQAGRVEVNGTGLAMHPKFYSTIDHANDYPPAVLI